MKKPSIRDVARYTSLALFIGLSLTILIESAFKGTESTKQSDAFANPIQDALNQDYDRSSLVDIKDFSLVFEKEGDAFFVGDSLTYSISYSPEDTSYKNLSFEVLDNHGSKGEILSVDEARNIIRFEKEGDARLIVSSVHRPEIQKSYAFRVQNIPLSGFEIQDEMGNEIESIHLKEGESFPLSFVTTPSNATNHNFLISSSLESSLEADEAFRSVYAKEAGEGSLSIVSKSDPTLQKEIPFLIEAKTEDLPSPTLQLGFEANSSLKEYERPSLDFDCLPLGTSLKAAITTVGIGKTNDAVHYLSSDPSILSVDRFGQIKGVKEGKACLKVISKENNGISLTHDFNVVGSVSPFLLDVDSLGALQQETYQNENGETYAYWVEVAYGKSYRIVPVAPNPFSSKFSFELAPSEAGKKDAIAIDQSGSVSTLSLGSGTVLVKASNGLFQWTEKITFHVVRDRKLSWSDVTTIVRKTIGHFGLFALTALSILPFIFLTWKETRIRLLGLVGSEVIGFGLAGFSELIQYYTEGRSGNWVDVGIDMGGYSSVVLIALIVLLVLHLRSKKKKNEENAEKENTEIVK